MSTSAGCSPNPEDLARLYRWHCTTTVPPPDWPLPTPRTPVPRTRSIATARKYYCNVVFTFPMPPLFNDMKLSPRWTTAIYSLIRGRGSIMRITLAVAVACLSLVAVTAGKDAEAAMRRQTNIAAQGLAPALRILAKEREVQLVYRAEVVGDQRTSGAAGDLTFEEALAQLLSGTGLTYRYLENNAVTIVPISSGSSSTVSTSEQAAGIVGSRVSESTSVTQSQGGDQGKGLGEQPRLAQATTTSNPSNDGAKKAKSSVTTDESSKETELQEVVVTGTYKFLSVDTSGTTGLPLPIEKVPQSISLVDNDFIEAADLKSLGEIAEYTPGALNVGAPGNLGSAIKLRGFTPGRAIDGVDALQPAFLYEPEYAIYDRLEVVKGPSSVIYGISSPGGLVNYVTKSAAPDTPSYVTVQAGLWDSYRVEGQGAGSLDEAGNVRAIGIAVFDTGNSFQDWMYHNKSTIYGGLNFDFGHSVEGYIHGGFERINRLAFDGIPTEADGSPAPLPRSFIIGSKELTDHTDAYHAEGDVTWHATDMLDLSLKGNYENANVVGGLGYASYLQQNGDISLNAYTGDIQWNHNYGIGAFAVYRFDALGLKNSFLSVSTLYQSNDTGYNQEFAANTGTANIFSGEESIAQTLDALLAGPSQQYVGYQKTTDLTVSAQSVLQLIDPLTLLLGASWAEPEVTTYSNGNSPPTVDWHLPTNISYRAGLVYEFVPGANAYVSYSQSFFPQPYTQLGGAAFPPLTGDQYEAGLKYHVGQLLLTGAVFELKEKGLSEYDTTIGGIDYYEPIGEVTNKGVELQAIGQITRQWQVNAGYSYLNPKVTEDIDSAIVGQTQLFLPKQTASLYTTYTVGTGVMKGLTFGGGPRYVSPQRTSYDGSTKDLPGYPLVDANVGYSHASWLVQLNVHNVLDHRYFINNYQTLFYGNVVGQPINAALSIRRTF
jgi:TonB-dependent siderophore receptor